MSVNIFLGIPDTHQLIVAASCSEQWPHSLMHEAVASYE
jgi:hypothetical protein